MALSKTPPQPEFKLLPEKRAAKLLGLSDRTLRNWRVRGGGSPYVKVSPRCIRYRAADLEAWAAGNLRKSTSDLGILNILK